MRQLEQNAASVEDDLYDLKQRFELLGTRFGNSEGDRKAYYETSQWAIRRNKEEVNSLRIENKRLSESIARIKKKESDGSGRASMSELEKFDHKICEIQKKFDELQDEARTKELKVTGLNDQLADLTRETELVNSNLKDSAQAKDIRMLENRLDKAVIKYNETQSIKKTYELIAKRLQEERLTFDSHLSNFEKTLRSKRLEAAELETMSRDANHAKEVAKAELARFEQQLNEERKPREKELQTRKEMIKHKQEVTDKNDKRATKTEDLATDERSKEEVVAYDEAAEKEMSRYEETMRLIKETTGVTEITQVLSKFQSQEDILAHLNTLQKVNDIRIQQLKSKKMDIIKEYEALLVNGESKQVQSLNIVEDFNSHLKESQEKYSDAKQNYDRSLKIMVNSKAGIHHLNDKLEAVRLNDQHSVPIAVTDTNVVEVLQTCVKKLEQLANNLRNKELPEATLKDPSQITPGEKTGILHVNQQILPALNVRVKLRPVEFEDADVEDDDGDEEEEVPDRESMKKQTLHLINARLKNNQPKKIKKKKSAKDGEDSS